MNHTKRNLIKNLRSITCDFFMFKSLESKIIIPFFTGVWEEVRPDDDQNGSRSYTFTFQYYQTTPDHAFAVTDVPVCKGDSKSKEPSLHSSSLEREVLLQIPSKCGKQDLQSNFCVQQQTSGPTAIINPTHQLQQQEQNLAQYHHHYHESVHSNSSESNCINSTSSCDINSNKSNNNNNNSILGEHSHIQSQMYDISSPQDQEAKLPENFTPLHLRSLEETEAAHDLLQLAQSAPAFCYRSDTPTCTNSDQSNALYISEPITPAPSPSGSSDAENVAPLEVTLDDGRSKVKAENSFHSRYTCSECGKHYATSSNLSRHKQTHRAIDSGNARRCHVCGKAYVSMPALAMHVLTHNLNHKCGICGKAFSRPWLLQGHMRSHTGEKPFGCAHCGKSFADRSNLRAHMQTHSQMKNFKCKKCNKSFALKSYLNKHYESACFRDGSCTESCDSAW